MRVTQSMLSTDFLRSLSGSYSRLSKYQQQLDTGKKINRPSDDPVVATMGMHYRTNVQHIEQYKRNLSTAYQWMDSADAALDDGTQVLQRMNELLIEAKNGTYEENERGDIGKEIEQLKNQMETIGNTKTMGKYIFNGTNTSEQPVDLSEGIQVSHNTDAVKIEVSDGVEIGVNVNPTHVFNQQLFDDLSEIEDHLGNGASSDEIGDYISNIQGHLDAFNSERAELGARYNRVEMAEDRLGSQNEIATKILSDNEDVDVSEAITNLIMQESVHRAALATGARIMQPTLMDFLR